MEKKELIERLQRAGLKAADIVGKSLNDSFQKLIDDAYYDGKECGAALQKEEDIFSAVNAFLDQKMNNEVIYILLSKIFPHGFHRWSRQNSPKG